MGARCRQSPTAWPPCLQAAEVPADEGGLGSRYRFRQRWFSTLPDTLDNNLRVNLGLGMPHDAIIADRAFNTRAFTNALLGYPAVESVEYDPRCVPGYCRICLATLPSCSASCSCIVCHVYALLHTCYLQLHCLLGGPSLLYAAAAGAAGCQARQEGRQRLTPPCLVPALHAGMPLCVRQ